MRGFYISIKNDLIEPKHVKSMGEAVWLYMWLIDKMTSISENGIGKVLNNSPITYEMVRDDLGISLRTYRRWIERLRQFGYINTTRSKLGLMIVVLKAKKKFNKSSSSGDKNGTSTSSRSARSGTSKVPEVAHLKDKNGTSLYKEDNYTVNNTYNRNSIGNSEIADVKSTIGKLYYEVIDTLDLPVVNHNNVRSKIAEMARDKEPQKMINYLIFMRDEYPTLDYTYKPQVSEALEIYSKRARIRETYKRFKADNRKKFA